MITWFAVAQISIGGVAGFLCLFEYLRKRTPNDYSLGATALVGILLVVQIVIAIVAPAFDNFSVGDPLEYWMYLIVATVLPFGAIFWALIDRSRSAHLVLMVVNVSVAVMLYRMLVIWG